MLVAKIVFKEFILIEGEDVMKKLTILLCASLLMISMVGAAGAITFSPADLDAGDLDHYKYYKWGINWSVPDGEKIVNAYLFIDNINDWTNESGDILYIHLLDLDSAGFWTIHDGQSGGDNLDGQGILLTTYTDTTGPYGKPNGTTILGEDFYYYLDDMEKETLTSYASNDGFLGFGFDPDCHYFNDGVYFTVETAHAPEPATMLLVGSGLVGFAGISKRLKKKK
jgi:hypothetical protein